MPLAPADAAVFKAELNRDIEDTRERIAAYNAGALLADQIAEDLDSCGWTATRVANQLRNRIASSRTQLLERIHQQANNLTARDYEQLVNRASVIGPDATAIEPAASPAFVITEVDSAP